mmetsp:Transcript_126635/g.404660  ORF Transcript_126635/g.404660 Transcript_126635/m.404660 type:complete len:364 (+) Transcript_126635:1399-2490(+)
MRRCRKKKDGYSHLQTRLQTRMISGDSNKADVDADCKHCLRKQNRHSVISGKAKYCGICGHKKPEGHYDERLFKEEHGKKWALDKWDDETYEAENDVFGLTGSYLTVQAIIFNITHTMEVQEPKDVHWSDSVKIICSALVFTAATVFAVMAYHRVPKSGGTEHSPGEMKNAMLRRVILVVQNASAMGLAWSMLGFFQWEIMRILPSIGGPETSSFRVLLSLIVSFTVLFVVRGLDRVADMEVTGDEADLTIFSIINALSILVGFSWEHAFHLGVEVVAVKLGYPVAGQFVLALIVAAVAIVPWRRHILQKVLHLEKEVAESKHMSLHKQEEQNIREMRQDSEGGPMEVLASTAQMHETSEPKD